MVNIIKDGNIFSFYEIEENDEIEPNPIYRGGNILLKYLINII